MICHQMHCCHSSRTYTESLEALPPHLQAQLLTFHHWQEGVASAARHLQSTAKSKTQHACCWVSDESITLNTHCIYTDCRFCERCICPSRIACGINSKCPALLIVSCHTDCPRAGKHYLFYLPEPPIKYLPTQGLYDLLAGSCLSLDVKPAQEAA